MTEPPTPPTNQLPPTDPELDILTDEVLTHATSQFDLDLLKYYTLRVTMPHKDYPELQAIIDKYSKNYCACLHVADDEVQHEHFHIFFLGMEDTTIEAMRKRLKLEFSRSGNGFMSGKKMDNHIFKALQYVKHDEHVTYKHRGSRWEYYIAQSPEWEEKDTKKEAPKKRIREADPMLTYSNVLWRARAHRKEHRIQSTSLGVVLEHMTRTTAWIPSQDLMRKGLDPMHHRMFEYQAGEKKGRTPDWWTPKFD